jgi:type III pantothenate kinase
MELVLDFGNTRRKITLFDSGKMLLMEHHPEISVEILREFIGKYPGITSCIVASVIHHSKEIDDFLKASLPTWILDHNTPLPFPNLNKAPEELGKDRLAAAVAGASKFPGHPVLVINTGTAVTYEVLSKDCEYLGGAISPGMALRFRALHTFTGKLPLIEYKENVPLMGNDTEGSILSGVINGIVGEMELFAARCMDQLPSLRIILSGGDLNYFVNRLKINIFAFPNIVQEGLHQILLFNVGKTT